MVQVDLARCRSEIAEIERDFATGIGTTGHMIGWLDWQCEAYILSIDMHRRATYHAK